MDVFLGEWLNLMLRWAHMVVGIGWIGTSFYFMALDYTLMKRERMNPGVYGTAWQVHGGGFYHVEKYTVAPPALPDVLHWFKWEAYLTFVTGFGLMIVQYYVHAEAYLIDPAVMPLTQWQAIAISVVSLTAGWFIYDGLCRTKVGEHTVLLALVGVRADPDRRPCSTPKCSPAAARSSTSARWSAPSWRPTCSPSSSRTRRR